MEIITPNMTEDNVVVDAVVEKYDWFIAELSPYKALEFLDCFANTVLGFDVLVPG